MTWPLKKHPPGKFEEMVPGRIILYAFGIQGWTYGRLSYLSPIPVDKMMIILNFGRNYGLRVNFSLSHVLQAIEIDKVKQKISQIAEMTCNAFHGSFAEKMLKIDK